MEAGVGGRGTSWSKACLGQENADHGVGVQLERWLHAKWEVRLPKAFEQTGMFKGEGEQSRPRGKQFQRVCPMQGPERKVEDEGSPAARRLVLWMADLTQCRADQRDL